MYYLIAITNTRYNLVFEAHNESVAKKKFEAYVTTADENILALLKIKIK